MVSRGADMKVYLEGPEKHHETGGVASEKHTNLFTHTVVLNTPAAAAAVAAAEASVVSYIYSICTFCKHN